MIKKQHRQQPFKTRMHRKRVASVLSKSEQHLKKQNKEFILHSTEYLALNEELELTKKMAEESDRLKSAFLANIFHEIRTPMNAIIGFSDYLMRADLPKVKTEQFLQIINTGCKRLLSVISDIVDISKIEANQIAVYKELVNINLLLTDIYTSYKKQACNNKIELIYSDKPEFSHIETITDVTLIKQVLTILLNNAFKFTQKGKIEIGLDVKDNFLEFYVKDTGIGIAAKNQTTIFDRFSQVENTNTRLYGGNGLGLSIAKALVEKLGGTITVSSRLKEGSTFSFTLPYVLNANLTENTKKIAKTNPSVNWAGKTILIVEDEVYSHAYIEQVLSSTNAKLCHAWNGEKAIKMVESHDAISLVLMDIKMPVINGYEATQQIKGKKPKLPVIAMTAYALNHDREKALQAGFDDYIAKPIPKDALLGLIAGYLN